MTQLARLGDPSVTLYLVDISSFIFRAFFAIRPLTTRTGEPTNAVYGVATMMARLADEAHPSYLAVVYDSKEPSFRKEIFADYKANRSTPPEGLVPQFARVEELIRTFGMHSYRQPGVEADDLIATLTRKWCAASPKNRVVVVTSDKDLMQLVNDRVCVWDTMSQKIYGNDEVVEKFGVKPDQIRDYLGLVGDSSDNIPGVPSIGPKTASDLLKQFEDIDAIIEAAKAGKITGKKAEALSQNEDAARLSKELATVHEDLKIDLDVEKLRYSFHVSAECVDLLRSLDFHTLVQRWLPQTGGDISVAATPAVTGGRDMSNAFRTVNTEKDFTALLEAMDKKKEFGFDLETTALNPNQANLVGVAICHDPSFGVYIPVGHRAAEVPQLPVSFVLDHLRPFLESPKYKKIGQNLKYDWRVLFKQGVRPDGIGADTMIGAYVLDPEGRHNLETLAAHYLDYNVTTYEQICGKGATQLTFDQISVDVATRYSAEDAWVAVQLWEQIRPRLQKEDLMRVFAEVDLPLVSVLARMENEGVCIDVPFLKSLSREFETDLARIEEQIHTFTKGPVNLNSPKQLAQLLFEELKLPVQAKTKTGYSTDAKVLADLAHLHEVPRLLLEYREISKLKGTYVDPLPYLRDPITGRIHATFSQVVAATGRLSSSDPNLQNIPVKTERGRRIRRAFVPSEGRVFVAADYSQIELRLLAHMSGDKELVKSFRADEDVHSRTASEIYGVSPKQVTDRQRGIAKAINFGLMYGKTAFGLAQELKISRKEAQEVIDRYFERYSGVKHFLDQSVLQAKERGFACTELGRKRPLPDLASRNPAVRNNAERMAMNTPIQGTAADMMKVAMLEVDARLARGGYDSKLIIQVHDELVLDCPKSEVDDVSSLLIEGMESAMKLSVPLKVNAASAENWQDL
jgi:DNA polymerase I